MNPNFAIRTQYTFSDIRERVITWAPSILMIIPVLSVLPSFKHIRMMFFVDDRLIRLDIDKLRVTNIKPDQYSEMFQMRNRRGVCSGCSGGCPQGFKCACGDCDASACLGTTCNVTIDCENPIKTTTTVDTPGILQLLSSYPQHQAIDECGGICYPGSVPNGTTLSGCSLDFIGFIPNTWYVVALQVSK